MITPHTKGDAKDDILLYQRNRLLVGRRCPTSGCKIREIAQAPQVRMTRPPCRATASHSCEGGRAARGRLTVGGRGVTPPSAIASPLNRAAGPARGPHWGSSANPILTQPGRIPTNRLRYTKTRKHNSAHKGDAKRWRTGATSGDVTGCSDRTTTMPRPSGARGGRCSAPGSSGCRCPCGRGAGRPPAATSRTNTEPWLRRRGQSSRTI